MLNPWIFIFKLVPTHLSISSLSYFLRWSSHRPLTMVLGALHTSRLCLVLAEVSEETKTKWLHLQSASPMAGLPVLLMSTKSVPCIWNGNAVRLLMHFTEHSETSFMALVWENQERRYYRTHRWREVQGESHSQAPWVSAKLCCLLGFWPLSSTSFYTNVIFCERKLMRALSSQECDGTVNEPLS